MSCDPYLCLRGPCVVATPRLRFAKSKFDEHEQYHWYNFQLKVCFWTLLSFSIIFKAMWELPNVNVLSQKMFTCSTTEIFVAFNCYYECVGSQRNHSINFSIKSVACLICCRKKVVSSLDHWCTVVIITVASVIFLNSNLIEKCSVHIF